MALIAIVWKIGTEVSKFWLHFVAFSSIRRGPGTKGIWSKYVSPWNSSHFQSWSFSSSI